MIDTADVSVNDIVASKTHLTGHLAPRHSSGRQSVRLSVWSDLLRNPAIAVFVRDAAVDL